MRREISFLLITILLTNITHQNDLNLVATGFLEIPENSEENFDYSSVEIYLINSEDKVTAKANPSENGFYLIPIESKKDYKLMIKNVKTTYQFEPKFHTLELSKLKNQKADDLLKEGSFNFRLTGFSFKSRVGYHSSEEFSNLPEGKEGIQLQLTKIGSDGAENIATSKSGKNGLFEFSDLMPGSYKVSVITENESDFVSTEMKCEYSWESGQSCEGGILISGSGVQGKLSILGEVYEGCYVLIKNLDGLDTSSCQNGAPSALKDHEFDCYTKTGKDGEFQFDNIPHGKYSLQFFDSEEDGIDFIEPVQEISHNLKESSEEREFDLKGSLRKLVAKVVTPGGKPIEGVKMVIDGEKIGETNHVGEISIEKLKIGEYDIEAIHPHFSFKAMRVKLNANSRREGNNPVNPLKADYMKLCGKIDYTQTETESTKGYKVQVKLVQADGKKEDANKQIRATVAKQDGSYCFEVPPGVYIVKPTIIFNGKKFNVKPKERKISAENEPALNVDFSREKLSIKGKVEMLKNVNKEFASLTIINLFNAAGNKVASRKWDELKKGVFEFEDLFEETYEIKLDNSKLCFDKSSIKTDENSGNTVFKQQGILVSYSSDFNFKLKVKSSNGIESNLEMKKGENQMCLREAGEIEGTVSDNYLLKNGMNQFTYNPESSTKLNFEIEKIKAQIHTKIDISKIKKIMKKLNKEDDDILSIFSLEILETKSKELIQSVPVLDKNLISSTFYSTPNKQLEITPKILDSEIAQRLVITQKTKKFKIGYNYKGKIQSNPFDISLGKRIFVEADKEIKNVKLTLNRRTNKNQQYKQFDNRKIDISSMILGTYSGNFDYNIELEKKGFEFNVEKTQNEENDTIFTIVTVQISQLVIRIKDSKGRPKKGVTAYITSAERGKALKIVEQSDKDGEIKKDVYKGKYYVKAFLKEYEFDPPQKMFSVEEGEVFELDIVAKRTRFSAYGVVRNFGGFDVSDIEIEAISDDEENPYSETAVSDRNGKYRIMGLIPGKSYKIKIKSAKTNIIIPESYDVKVEDEDFRSNDFILAENWNLVSIQGGVEISGDIAQNEAEKLLPLRLKLTEVLSEKDREEYNPDVREVKLRNYKQYEFIDLDSETYKLELFTGNSQDPIFSKNFASKDLKKGLNKFEKIVIKRSDLNIIEAEKSSTNIVVVLVLVGAAFWYNFSSKKN